MSRGALSLILAAGLAGAETGAPVEYVGGTLAALSGRAEGRLLAVDDHVLSFRMRRGSVEVPYSRVNLLEYGQTANRRYAMAVLVSPVLLLSKKRAHFLTVGYSDEQGRQQAMVFRVGKNDIRSVLASLEARTGRKVQYQDAEARKSGVE